MRAVNPRWARAVAVAQVLALALVSVALGLCSWRRASRRLLQAWACN